MALKIVQTITAVEPPNNGISTSGPINLKTGYLRLTSTGASNFIEIIDGNHNVAVSSSSLAIPQDTSEILKERVARQKISGITTGSSTVVSFSETLDHPFIVGDCVSIIGAQPSGINTNYSLITAVAPTSVTLAFNSSSVTGIITTTNSTLARSVKVSVYTADNNSKVNIAEVQIASQA